MLVWVFVHLVRLWNGGMPFGFRSIASWGIDMSHCCELITCRPNTQNQTHTHAFRQSRAGALTQRRLYNEREQRGQGSNVDSQSQEESFPQEETHLPTSVTAEVRSWSYQQTQNKRQQSCRVHLHPRHAHGRARTVGFDLSSGREGQRESESQIADAWRKDEETRMTEVTLFDICS